MSSPAASALVLLAAAAAPFDLPPLPSQEAGLPALWSWLRTVNSALSIPDLQFRWMFGGFSIPIILLFEVVGVRKDWRLYPFLLPFWLIFGSIAFGVVGGLAATAAHLALFPVGRVWFMVRERRVRDVGVPAHSLATPAAAPPARSTQDVLRSALEAIRAADRRRVPPAAGAPPGKPDLSAFRPDLSRFRRRPR
jgi:hypothetical protein